MVVKRAEEQTDWEICIRGVLRVFQETTELDFSKHLFSNHLTLPLGRMPDRSASPG